MNRFAPLALAALALCATPAFAQSEEDVYNRIETLQGDADGFFAVFGAVQDAIMLDDPSSLTSNVSYPITIAASGEVYDVLSEDDFLDNFDTLLSADTRQAISGQDVADLLVNGEGVAIGNGAVWISNVCLDDACSATHWYVTAVNN